MLHSKYRWNCVPCNEDAARQLSDQLNISSLLASLLVTRGIEDVGAAKLFLFGNESSIHDPYLLAGMTEAVPRIRQAIESNESILIYGDYDADGVSSTALMIHLMRHVGATFDYYIPHRSKEGYGLHIHAIDEAYRKGITLIITVDTGISAVEQIAYARTLGIDVIVTDHHEPPKQLPEAYALINPKLPNCMYPFKGLAGVGVAYKLACAMLGDRVPSHWLELVAMGTVADLMPLIGENRMLVRSGLASMEKSSFVGITSLLQVAGRGNGEVTSTDVGFGLAPRINASGRLSHASRAVTLLTTENMIEAEEIADELDLLNRERQQIVEEITLEAMAQLEYKSAGQQIPKVIVIAGEGWNVGVVGIVASKIVERYYRPTIILAINPETGECKGSARSTPGLDIYEALTDCSELLDHYGGHPAAAGMSLQREHLTAFDERLNEFASSKMEPEHFIPELTADIDCRLDHITLSVIEEMQQLAPFGMDNATPRLLIKGAQLLGSRVMGQDGKHLKLTLSQNGSIIEAVAFGKGELANLLVDGSTLDIVAEANVNEWNGSRKPQLMLQDVSVPHVQVFDHRASKFPVQKLAEFDDKMASLSNNMGVNSVSAAVCRFVSLPYWSEQLNQTALWVYDDIAGLTPANEMAIEQMVEQITNLYMLELPDKIIAFEQALENLDGLERIVFLYGEQNKQELLKMPTREQFKQVYVLLRQHASTKTDESILISKMLPVTQISRRMLGKTLDVFEELLFIKRENGRLEINPTPSKQPLESSKCYQELATLAEMEHMLVHAGTSVVTDWLMSRLNLKGVS